MNIGELIFFCGKMGSGKSTKSHEIALKKNAVLLSEDEWLESHYPNQINSIESYLKYSNQIKPQIKKLVQSILTTGTNVVMDFPANTFYQRKWFRGIFSEISAPHNMIFINATDTVCLKQIKKRGIEQPERAATDTIEMFENITKHFVAPEPTEGFHITEIINK